MSNEATPKQYKYQLEADDFVKLFLASDEEFRSLKNELLADTPNDITRSNSVTYFKDTKIKGIIFLKKILFDQVSSLACYNVGFDSSIDISDFKTDALFANSHFYFNNSSVPYLSIRNCSHLNLTFYSCSMKDLVFTNSTIKEVSIRKSKIAEFRVTLDSQVDEIKINESAIYGFKLYSCKIDTIETEVCNFLYFTSSNSSINKLSIREMFIERIEFDGVDLNYLGADKVYCHLLTIVASKIKLLQFFNCQISSLGSLRHIEEAEFYECYINSANFNYLTMPNDSVFIFSKTHFYNIQMNYFNMLGTLFFKELNLLNEPFELFKLKDIYTDELSKKMICISVIKAHLIQYDSIKEEYL